MPESYEASVTLTGDLHARPAGALAVAAAKFTSSVELTVGASRADAKSVLAVMGLGASSGQQVGHDRHQILVVQGPDPRDAQFGLYVHRCLRRISHGPRLPDPRTVKPRSVRQKDL